jgi:hypothetical protein
MGCPNWFRGKCSNKNLKNFISAGCAPGISHLFADDTLIFFQANGGQAEIIKDIIVL